MIFGRVFGWIFGAKRHQFSRLMGFILDRFLDQAFLWKLARRSSESTKIKDWEGQRSSQNRFKNAATNQSKNHCFFIDFCLFFGGILASKSDQKSVNQIVNKMSTKLRSTVKESLFFWSNIDDTVSVKIWSNTLSKQIVENLIEHCSHFWAGLNLVKNSGSEK